ncbi:hypothetical protein [Bdellovibrio sp. KM01]|uniref:hypothetical protein n=1 Tax=Bdellovibrio sp. KM01 TaxID=2748865 RepID=UPI0015E923CF|nr:hypothetical protein [Bdellovibrio sp. KM01]QLY24267.1 hypothetical protein HW988_12420 [Bdellovibrio sp. KM01]
MRRYLLPIGIVLGTAAFGFFLRQGPMLSAAPIVEKSSSPIEKRPASESQSVIKTNDLFCEKSYDSICKGNAVADPTGETSLDYRGEIRALRVLRRIVRTNPGWTTEQIEDELVTRIYTPERKEKLHRIFELVRAQMIEYIKQQSSKTFSDVDKATLIERISKVNLELPVDRTTYSDATDLYTKSEIYYERSHDGEIHRVRVGGAYVLNTSSEFSIIFTMAHELAHSIDPCGIQGENLNQAVYNELVQCFVDSQWIKKEEAQCGNKDKTSEVFADWVGSEILARFLRTQTKYSIEEKTRAAINAVRDLCDDSSGFEKVNLEYYPTDVIRVKSIFSKNTLLRKELQCVNSGTVKPYCRFEPPKLKGPQR